jgi:hypothetical protein
LKAFVLDRGVDIDRIVRAVATEVDNHARCNGGLKDAVLVLEIRQCVDDKKDDETAP